MAAAAIVVTALATIAAKPPTGSILSPTATALSPYRRTSWLQPRRTWTDCAAAFAEASRSVQGLPTPGRLGYDIEIRDAGRRGRGLFALRDYYAGEMVTRYTGIIASIKEYREAYYSGLTTGDYMALANEDGSLVVDSERSDEAGPGRYVNHSKRGANCRIARLPMPTVAGMDVTPGLLYIQCERDVPAGSEFLTDYGDKYWERENVSIAGLVRKLVVDYGP